MLLKDRLGDLSGLEAVVIGRSNIVGKPMAQLLLRENCTVTIAHSRTRDLPDVVRRGDIVVAAVGRAEMVKGDWLKPGATVIDVGINRVPRKTGNRWSATSISPPRVEVAGAITPVPGGVGPMTIACLIRNTFVSAARPERFCLRRGPMIELFVSAFVTFLVVIDPPGCAPIFASLTRGTTAAHRRAMAIRSTVIAWAILMFFALLGRPLLQRARDQPGRLPHRRRNHAVPDRARHGVRDAAPNAARSAPKRSRARPKPRTSGSSRWRSR